MNNIRVNFESDWAKTVSCPHAKARRTDTRTHSLNHSLLGGDNEGNRLGFAGVTPWHKCRNLGVKIIAQYLVENIQFIHFVMWLIEIIKVIYMYLIDKYSTRVGQDIFIFSAPADLNSRKFDGETSSQRPQPSLSFFVYRKTKMAALAPDWLRHFLWLLLCYCWTEFFLQVLVNSVPQFQRSKKCLSQSEARVTILFFSISLKNTNLVEDVEFMVSVKLWQVLYTGFREVKYVLSVTIRGQVAILFEFLLPVKFQHILFICYRE